MPEKINKRNALDLAVKITIESAHRGTVAIHSVLRKTYDMLCEILQEIKDYESEGDS